MSHLSHHAGAGVQSDQGGREGAGRVGGGLVCVCVYECNGLLCWTITLNVCVCVCVCACVCVCMHAFPCVSGICNHSTFLFSLQKIEGLDSLVNLEKLFLGRNKITRLEVTQSTSASCLHAVIPYGAPHHLWHNCACICTCL